MDDAESSSLDVWDEEMDDVEGIKREAIRKPNVSTSTSTLPHAMFAVGATLVAVPCGAVSCGTTGATPSLGSPCDEIESRAGERKIKGFGSLHVETHHERAIRVGRTREQLRLYIAAVSR